MTWLHTLKLRVASLCPDSAHSLARYTNLTALEITNPRGATSVAIAEDDVVTLASNTSLKKLRIFSQARLSIAATAAVIANTNIRSLHIGRLNAHVVASHTTARSLTVSGITPLAAQLLRSNSVTKLNCENHASAETLTILAQRWLSVGDLTSALPLASSKTLTSFHGYAVGGYQVKGVLGAADVSALIAVPTLTELSLTTDD